MLDSAAAEYSSECFTSHPSAAAFFYGKKVPPSVFAAPSGSADGQSSTGLAHYPTTASPANAPRGSVSGIRLD